MFATLPRLILFFTIIPVTGPKILPLAIRNVICFSMALFLFPLIASSSKVSTASLDIVVVMIKEAAIGLIAGFIISKVFWLILAAGSIIAQNIGGTDSTVTDLISGEETSAIGSLIFMSLVTIFFVNNGFELLLNVMFMTYKIWPVFSFFPEINEKFLHMIVTLFDSFFSALLLFCAPALIAMFLITLGLGLINRFAPKLNVFILAMPVKSLVALIIITLAFSSVVDLFKKSMTDFTSLLTLLENALNTK